MSLKGYKVTLKSKKLISKHLYILIFNIFKWIII